MYKEGIRSKVRFETSKGLLSIEQLWDLSRTQLATVVRNLKKKLKEDSDDDLAFLDDTAKQVDKLDQLKFNIAKDIYLTKKAEYDASVNEAEIKANNQKILAIIKEKQEASLKDMSVEDLEKLIK